MAFPVKEIEVSKIWKIKAVEVTTRTVYIWTEAEDAHEAKLNMDLQEFHDRAVADNLCSTTRHLVSAEEVSDECGCSCHCGGWDGAGTCKQPCDKCDCPE